MIHNVYGHISDRKLGEFFLEVQRIQLEKERVRLAAMGAIAMFFTFLVVGPILFILGMFTLSEFLALHFVGLAILVIASYPYVRTLQKEENVLARMENKLKK